jgi:hypothetical protein
MRVEQPGNAEMSWISGGVLSDVLEVLWMANDLVSSSFEPAPS